jgi:hypothetical protein
MSDQLGPHGVVWQPNGIGQFKIGISPIGTRPILNPWDTIISQYANSPTIIQLIINMQAYLDPTENIEAFYDLMWNIDTAQGYGLDVWGRIVGVGRVLQIPAGTYFGFQGPTGASGTGFNQAIFYSGEPATSNYSLTDATFRALILAKAFYNICNGTIQAINQIMINLFGANGPFPVSGNSYCTDGENMTMTYSFGAALSPLQSAIVNQSGVVPKPAGVSYTVVVR